MEKNYGMIIKKLREKNGYTQTQVAAYLKITQSYLNRMESNERPVKISMMKKLVNLYGYSYDDLVNENLVNENLEIKPIALAYRATNIKQEDFEAIAIIKKLALNMRMMEKLISEC